MSYDGQGCSISQASTSVLTDQVIGTTVGDALKTVAAFTEMVSSRAPSTGTRTSWATASPSPASRKYPARVKCALLGWMAFKDAVAQASHDSEEKR